MRHVYLPVTGRGKVCLAWLLLCGIAVAADDRFALLHQPTVSKRQIAFVYADELWAVSRAGGEAVQLTNGRGPVDDPAFSPDGSWVAFTANFDGNTDVYAIPSAGGEPRRLTFHPGADNVAGWTADGKRVLFRSGRARYMGFDRLYTVPLAGGFEEELPLPMAEEGSYSPDGRKLAYVPLRRAFETWKRYRGGRTTPIWIADLATSRIEKIPRDNSNDFQPMWRGDRIYFLSDREGPVTLFSLDTTTRRVTRLIENRGLDINAASAGPDAIAYEQFGAVHLFDLKTNRETAIHITFPQFDSPALQSHIEKVVNSVENVSVSAAGDVLFEARGEIFRADASGGVRNLTGSPGVAERDPAWSPDARQIAYFSDEGGEYMLRIMPADAPGPVRTLALADPPSYYYAPTWSPDGRKLAYLDKHLTLWIINAAGGKPARIDADNYGGGYRIARLRNPVWSPDGRAIAYTKELPNHQRALFLYSVEQAKPRQITDGMADVRFPAFDRGGSLYFTASTALGPSGGNRQVYTALLDRNDAIVPVPLTARAYTDIEAGPEGILYLMANDTLYKFDTVRRKEEKLLEGIARFTVSIDGSRVLYEAAGRWITAPGQALRLGGLEMRVDPRQEWRQIYREALRIERDFFYDPKLRGVDLKSMEQRFQPYVDNLATRADLNYILREILGNLKVSHLAVGGGDPRGARQERVGLLGADYTIENGLYRFARIYPGDRWNPARQGPLAQPGAEVHEGEYLRAVNGKPLSASANIYQAFEDLAGKQVKLQVTADPTGTVSREVAVKPIYPLREFLLRYEFWIEQNRRQVDRMTKGRVGYLHLPDTDDDGHRNFDRYFFAQVDKEALLIDIRFNGGGSQPAEYFMDYLQRSLENLVVSRDGAARKVPAAAVFGPKVMLINEYTGSGGDALAHYFRQAKQGPLIGKRTWGGLIGTHRIPKLIDGGEVTAPDLAGTLPNGTLLLENKGEQPDEEVELSPEAWNSGQDSQLEAAISKALELLNHK